MPCASFIKVMAEQFVSLFSVSDKTKEIQSKRKEESNVSEKETEEELSAVALANKKTRTEVEYSEPKRNVRIRKFETGRPWLNLILKIQSL